MVGPIDHHYLRDDPVSAGAVRTLSIGERKLVAVSDGFLRIPADFVGSHTHPHGAFDALSAVYGHDVRLPMGCFFVPGERNVLVDAGFGPTDFLDKGTMIGGRLLEQLAGQGVEPADIDVLTLSHLHADHIGWVGDGEGNPVFVNARTYVAREDWVYFVEQEREPAPAPHIRHALLTLADRGQIELIDGEAQIAPGVTRLAAPGHTPGHSIYVIHDRGERVMLFGDALYCPQQLTNLDWAAATDVDPVLARRTRETYLRDLERHGGQALGCHFPELLAGRALVRPEAIDS